MAPGATGAVHSLTLGGNLTNDGTFDCRPSSTRLINATFNNTAGDQTIGGGGGGGAVTRFNLITLDKGSPPARSLPRSMSWSRAAQALLPGRTARGNK